jgi:hypothetical protein
MRHEGRRRPTNSERAQLEYAILSVVLEQGAATTDDAHALYELPKGVDQRYWGAASAGLVARGLLRRVGEAHSRRVVAHGRRIGLFIAPNVARARRRLTTLAAIAARRSETLLTLFETTNTTSGTDDAAPLAHVKGQCS